MQPNTARPLALSPKHSIKKEEKTFLSLSLPLLSTTSPCGCHSVRTVPNADATLPRCYRVPHLVSLARSPPLRELLAPSRRVRRPPGRAKPGATSDGGGDGARAAPAPTPTAGIARPRPPACCKRMFQVFQIFRRYVSSVSCGCYKSRSRCCVCCNSCTCMLQAFIPYVSFVFSDV